MKLEPLKQWICDTCGEIIKKPEDGYVQFGHDKDLNYNDFLIVHHFSVSPLKEEYKYGCYKYKSDLDLKYFVNDSGIAYLLSFIDVGTHIETEYTGSKVSNLRKWVDFFRRLHTPYYEEARLYWDKAMDDGYFSGANEYWPYLPETLKNLIEIYGKE